MMDALKTLIDNGCPDATVDSVLNDIIANDDFEIDGDKRCCIALLFDKEQGDYGDPGDYSACADIVEGPYREYRVLTDEEADAACAEYIENSVWVFCPSFLSGETGIDEFVFEAMQDKGEDANDAVLSLIRGSCGLEDFVESAMSADGRGTFLNHCDSEEYEVSINGVEYYLYRVN